MPAYRVTKPRTDNRNYQHNNSRYSRRNKSYLDRHQEDKYYPHNLSDSSCDSENDHPRYFSNEDAYELQGKRPSPNLSIPYAGPLADITDTASLNSYQVSRKKLNSFHKRETYNIAYVGLWAHNARTAPSRNLIGRDSMAIRHSGWKYSDFERGDIIGCPDFNLNFNPRIDENDVRLADTEFGPLLSKFRWYVVVKKHPNHMRCLPMYTFGRRGLHAKPKCEHHEYVQVKDIHIKAEKWDLGASLYEPLEYDSTKTLGPFLPQSVIKLTSEHSIDYNAPLELRGRLTEKGFEHMHRLWVKLGLESEDTAFIDRSSHEEVKTGLELTPNQRRKYWYSGREFTGPEELEGEEDNNNNNNNNNNNESDKEISRTC